MAESGISTWEIILSVGLRRSFDNSDLGSLQRIYDYCEEDKILESFDNLYDVEGDEIVLSDQMLEFLRNSKSNKIITTRVLENMISHTFPLDKILKILPTYIHHDDIVYLLIAVIRGCHNRCRENDEESFLRTYDIDIINIVIKNKKLNIDHLYSVTDYINNEPHLFYFYKDENYIIDDMLLYMLKLIMDNNIKCDNLKTLKIFIKISIINDNQYMLDRLLEHKCVIGSKYSSNEYRQTFNKSPSPSDYTSLFLISN